jgi:hypothetical protein
VPFSFTKSIQRGLGTATAHSSGRTGLYSGSVIAEQVALGEKYPVVLLLLTAFSVLTPLPLPHNNYTTQRLAWQRTMYIFSSSVDSFLLLDQRLANITSPIHPIQATFMAVVCQQHTHMYNQWGKHTICTSFMFFVPLESPHPTNIKSNWSNFLGEDSSRRNNPKST